MSQERLGNDEFLARLTTLLSSTHAATHGSVYLTQKPLIPADDQPTTQILVRATNGLSKLHRTIPKSKAAKSSQPPAKVKIATVVEVADLDSFYARYAEVCKKGMEALRKRDKKKAKEKAKAKKKGKGAAGANGS